MTAILNELLPRLSWYFILFENLLDYRIISTWEYIGYTFKRELYTRFRLQQQKTRDKDKTTITASTTTTTTVTDQTVHRYIKSMEKSSKKTAAEYRKRLNYFKDFVSKKNNLTLDQLVMTLTHYSHGPKIDVYDLLSDYVTYIQEERNVSPLSLKLLASTVRSYLETFDVEISPRKFRFKVRMPRVIRTKKKALQKSDVQTILNACHSLKLKTYLLFLAATGCRAAEALSIRLCDIDFKNDPATAFIRGEYTKTGEDRVIPLTRELAQQLNLWINYKHRTRIVSFYDKTYEKTYTKKHTPKVNGEIFLFSTKYNHNATVHGLYTDLLLMFENTVDRLGGKYAEFEHTKKRRKFTLHSFRRFVKTTISDLGYHEYSEDYIGHKGSSYYTASDKNKLELFRKIEPYLTFLDQSSLEKKSAEVSDRLEIMEQENRELRENMNKIMEMIQQNPKLAQVKPEVLTKKNLDRT